MKRPCAHLPNAGTCEGEVFYAASLKPQASSFRNPGTLEQ